MYIAHCEVSHAVKFKQYIHSFLTIYCTSIPSTVHPQSHTLTMLTHIHLCLPFFWFSNSLFFFFYVSNLLSSIYSICLNHLNTLSSILQLIDFCTVQLSLTQHVLLKTQFLLLKFLIFLLHSSLSCICKCTSAHSLSFKPLAASLPILFLNIAPATLLFGLALLLISVAQNSLFISHTSKVLELIGHFNHFAIHIYFTYTILLSSS